jgi:hypothetical protein
MPKRNEPMNLAEVPAGFGGNRPAPTTEEPDLAGAERSQISCNAELAQG